MRTFTAVSGIITQIQPDVGNGSSYGCSMTLTVQSPYQGITQFVLGGDTYVVDNTLLQTGDQVTLFYDTGAPVPLIYPPRYKAVVAAKSDVYQYYLGEFDNDYTSIDNSLRINGSIPIRFFLPNGQLFPGAITGKTCLVEYRTATRSMPPIVNADRVIVFCYSA